VRLGPRAPQTGHDRRGQEIHGFGTKRGMRLLNVMLQHSIRWHKVTIIPASRSSTCPSKTDILSRPKEADMIAVMWLAASRRKSSRGYLQGASGTFSRRRTWRGRW